MDRKIRQSLLSTVSAGRAPNFKKLPSMCPAVKRFCSTRAGAGAVPGAGVTSGVNTASRAAVSARARRVACRASAGTCGGRRAPPSKQRKGVQRVVPGTLRAPSAADAGFAGVGPLRLGPKATIARKSSWLAANAARRTSGRSGGGGNRTRVRNRTGQSIYKLRSLLNFALRPVGTDQPFGLVLL